MGQISLGEQAAPATPASGVIIYPTVATPSILRMIDDSGADWPLGRVISSTWTPVLRGSGTAGTNTYTTQIGRYVKIGVFVTAWFNIVINAKDGAMTGTMQLIGLPFTSKNMAGFIQTGIINYWTGLATAIINPSLLVQPNTQLTDMLRVTAAATGQGSLVPADLQNGSQLIGTLAYEADA